MVCWRRSLMTESRSIFQKVDKIGQNRQNAWINKDIRPAAARRAAAPPSQEPEPKAQRNFTDPESRILKTKDGYIQGYNAQAAVDADNQIIVAHTLSNNGSDQPHFAPLLNGIKTNLRRNPDEVSADAGYCSAANLRTLSRRRIKGYIATGRQKHGAKSATATRSAKPGSPLARMAIRLRRAGHRSRYRLRKQVVEPVFGQIKEAGGFRQFPVKFEAEQPAVQASFNSAPVHWISLTGNYICSVWRGHYKTLCQPIIVRLY